MHEPQPSGEIIQTRVLRGDAERLDIDVEADGPRHAPEQRGKGEHAGAGTNIQNARGTFDAQRFIEGFETERGGRVKSRAERRTVTQPECARWCGHVGRNDQQAPDTNRPPAQQPDGPVVMSLGRRHRHTVNPKCALHARHRHAVWQERRQPACEWFDVQRTQPDEPIECLARRIAHVDAVGHEAG